MSDTTEVSRRRPSRKVLIAIGSVLAIALVAVVSVLTGGHVKTENGQAVSPLVGKTIKVFSARGVTSASVESPWAHGRPTVIVFFGSWCTICHSEMPKIAAYLRAHDVAPVAVLGDDNNEPLSDARAFVKKLNVNFPVASDPNNNISVGVFGFSFGDPETVFLNKRGVVKEVHLGAISIKQLKQGIAALASA
ncbi:MAG: TlpA disulfide reductase family protein [Acidimicrobiales bacterium]